MTKVVNMHEKTPTIAYSEVAIGEVFEYCGKHYIKFFDGDDVSALQLSPADDNDTFMAHYFQDYDLVIPRDCTITIE